MPLYRLLVNATFIFAMMLLLGTDIVFTEKQLRLQVIQLLGMFLGWEMLVYHSSRNANDLIWREKILQKLESDDRFGNVVGIVMLSVIAGNRFGFFARDSRILWFEWWRRVYRIAWYDAKVGKIVYEADDENPDEDVSGPEHLNQSEQIGDEERL